MRSPASLKDISRSLDRPVRDSVDYAEVDCFRARTHTVCNHSLVNSVDSRRCASVDVLAFDEGAAHRRVIAQRSEQTKLYLRVICIDKDASLRRRKGLAKSRTLLRPDRNILQIRVS